MQIMPGGHRCRRYCCPLTPCQAHARVPIYMPHDSPEPQNFYFYFRDEKTEAPVHQHSPAHAPSPGQPPALSRGREEGL